MTHPRDLDLIYPDEHFTDATLDELWEWYITNRNNVDPTILFVKLVNSVSQDIHLWRDHLSTKKCSVNLLLVPYQLILRELDKETL